ncbi:MAG: hypothetical protein E7283_00880 [Lachnospiraceae bacterium]|nr:hypothetical protein [Lachnospiraceae bacterium]
MKKRISVLVAAVLAIGCLATGCDGAAAGGEVSVGLGLHTQMDYSSKDATADKAGLAQADLTVAAVTLDAEGKIVSIKVDAIQVKTNFDATGAITADTPTSFKTKRELGNDYNMKGTSESIGKIPGGAEWFEQANAFEGWAKGKTLAQVEAVINADGYSTDDTLTAGCTMKINGFVAATVKAIKEAQAGTYKAPAADALSIGIVAEVSSPTSASAEKAGGSTSYANFVAVTSNNGKISCCILDSVQAKIAWDTTGKITSDLTEDTTTKYDLKEKYGMKETSANKGVIAEGGEWYEQADVFMAHVKNMTVDQVKAIAVDDGGYPTEDTLKAGCTMKVTAYIAAVEKALK